eukprot:gene147-199_t
MLPILSNLQHAAKKSTYLTLLIVVMLCLSTVPLAKNKEKVKIKYSADKLEGREKESGQSPYKQLTGHVVFSHEDFTIYADAAQYEDDEGLLKASGNLSMKDKNGGVMRARTVTYDVNHKVAKLRDDVCYEQDTLKFYTQQMDYVVQEQKGYFYQGGTLKQHSDQISSQTGYYDEKNKLAAFFQQVAFSNQDYQVVCDTLYYHADTKWTIFEGRTSVTTKDGESITTREGGRYNTDTQQASFKQATLDAPAYRLFGHVIEANHEKKQYTVRGRVSLTAKEHQTTITGTNGHYDQHQGIGEITGMPLLQRVMEGDTLYMMADMFKVLQDKNELPDQPQNHVVLGYPNVKIYKQNLQAKADSMAYHSLDSTLYFYNHPVFWNHDSQITADSISIVLANESIEKMCTDTNVFIVSKDRLENYNQIKGKNMVAYFKDNQMSHIEIEGNGESLYFALRDDQEVVGMNYLRCSHIRIDMAQEALSKISFLVQPTGIFYPARKVPEASKKLAGFVWKIDEKPTLEDFLARK